MNTPSTTRADVFSPGEYLAYQFRIRAAREDLKNLALRNETVQPDQTRLEQPGYRPHPAEGRQHHPANTCLGSVSEFEQAIIDL